MRWKPRSIEFCRVAAIVSPSCLMMGDWEQPSSHERRNLQPGATRVNHSAGLLPESVYLIPGAQRPSPPL